MIVYAWDAVSDRFARLSLCGLTIGVEDIDSFCVRYAELIAAAPAVHWCPADPSGRNREMPAADCCELLLENGKEGVWLVAVERGYEKPWVPDEVVVAFSAGERETLSSFVAYQVTRALSKHPCGGGHYRDWKAGWSDGESDMVVHLERETGWAPRPFPDGRVREARASSSADCPFLGSTSEQAVERWGESVHWFPSAGVHARSAGVWPDATLWFDGGGRCCFVQVRRGAGASVGSVNVLSTSYASTVSRLGECLPDLIEGREGATSLSAGISLTAPARWRCSRPAPAVSFMPRTAMMLRAEMLRPIARAALPCGWRERVRLFGQWLRDFPYSVAHPPHTRLRIIEEELDRGRWSDAVAFFVIAVDSLGIDISAEDRELVVELCEELGVEEQLGGW